jgi:O-antigen/teichoic acid export membrane protein
LIADLGIAARTTVDLAKDDNNRVAILSVTLSSRAALSIIAIPIIMGLSFALYPHMSDLFRTSLAIMSLDVLFTTLQVTASAAYTVRVKGGFLAIMAVTGRALYVLGAVITASVHGTYLGYVSSYVAADFIIAIATLWGAYRYIPFKWNFDFRAWWRSTQSAIPLGAIQIVDGVYAWVDSLLISVLRSSSDLGYFSIAFNITNLLGSMPNYLMYALIPSLVNADRGEIKRILDRAIYILVCVGSPLATGGIVLRKEIVLAIAGSKFLPTIVPLAILTVSLPVSFIQTALGYTSVAIDRFRPLLFVSMLTLTANVIANYFVIPRYGIDGAAWTLLGSESLSMFATYQVFKKLTNIRVQWVGLWRPIVASLSILGLAAIKWPIWDQKNRYLALLVGGVLVLAIYLFALVLMRGVPHTRFSSRRGQHRRRPL